MQFISKSFANFIEIFYGLIKDDGKNIKSSNVVMVVIAKHDFNGAMSVPSYFEIKNFFKRDIKLVYKTVETLEEINDFSKELKERSNTIQGLWIKAHGNPETIRFGSDTKEDSNHHVNLKFFKMSNILNPTFQALEKDANIILNSCSTANTKYGYSIAEKIAFRSKRTVFAPKHKLSTHGTQIYLESGQIKAAFTKRKNFKNGFKNLFSSLFFPIFPDTLSKNITREIKVDKE